MTGLFWLRLFPSVNPGLPLLQVLPEHGRQHDVVGSGAFDAHQVVDDLDLRHFVDKHCFGHEIPHAFRLADEAGSRFPFSAACEQSADLR